MNARYSLVSCGVLMASIAAAEVKELDGAELVDTFVQGISIAQPVTDKAFAEDDQAMRDGSEDTRNAIGAGGEPSVVVSNAGVLDRAPAVDDLITQLKMDNRKTGDLAKESIDLVEASIMQTSLSTRLDVNLETLSTKTGVPVADAASKDFSVLRGSILELLPSTTGYQLELLKDRY